MFRYHPLSFFLFALLLGDALGNSSVNPRLKRALYHRYGHHSSKLSLKDLALELAQLHLRRMIVDEKHALEKAKESSHITQRDCCTYIKFVGKPVSHKVGKNTQGAWIKDPLAIMGAETIFVMENYGSNRVLQEFENMGKLKAGTVRKTYKLPYYWDGTGAVVYGPHLYYNRANTNFIIKYNLRTERVEAQLRVSGDKPRKNHYAWGGGSGMDLAADEQGLWVLWGSTSNSYRLYASKIDVHKNVITYVWALNTEKMNTMGNAFVAYGVIYTIDSYSSKSTTINFAYDTKTGRQWNPNIQFTNQYRYNSMVAYNPRERVLYAWDNKRLVTYPITFY